MTEFEVFDGVMVDRSIFVPAIMSAGLVFSLVAILRDAVHDRRRPGRQRRIGIAARAVARHTVTGRPSADVLDDAVRPRTTYLLLGVSALAAAGYIGLGAIFNYARADGYVSDIAWLLAVSVLTTVLLGAVGVVGLALGVVSPRTPRWAMSLLVSTPLGQVPDADHARSQRRFLLGWGTIVAGVSFGVLTLAVATSHTSFQRFDERITDWVMSIEWIDEVRTLNVLGSTEVALGLALVVGVATLRCVPFALVYVSSVLGTMALDVVLKAEVERARPAGTVLSALDDSYPSGHLAQVVIIAGFVPLAIEVLTGLKWHTHVIGVVLAVTVVVAGLVRIEEGVHWPTDVIGGAMFGGAVSLFGHWVLESTRWHARCHTCPWVPHEHRRRGAVHIPDGLADRLRRGSLIWSAGAIGVVAGLGAVRGIPRNPDNDLLGHQIEGPLTVFALSVLVLGWAVALRWNGAGAVGLVVGGSVLAVVSSVAHHPFVALTIMLGFLLPSIALWLAWQHDQSRRALMVLAAVTTSLLIGVYSASATVHDHFFGPQHPQSATPALPVDRVDWVLAGAVHAEGFQVSVRADDDERMAAALLVLHRGVEVTRTEVLPLPPSRIVRFVVDGLSPSVRYDYVVEVDGHLDTTRGRGSVRTFAHGPSDLRVAFGSCARSGSNGTVFDAIRSLDPDLYVVTGDLHYGNPDRPDPGLFRAHFDRVFTASAQAALFREVPFAYVWDDHDYGPNDADATSPTRETAQEVYREVVPSAVAPSGPINQAFTAGRVRFVFTDTRSARTEDSMMGEQQHRWLEDELRRAKEHAVVIWVNPDPWIAASAPGRDDWGGFPDDRARILEVIDRFDVDNLVMVSGDAHMVAIDDGTNTGGFPLLHAAALDRPGTVKGGPYSHGTYPGAGQFGLVEIDDDGGTHVRVTLSGRTHDGRELVRHSFTIAVDRPVR